MGIHINQPAVGADRRWFSGRRISGQAIRIHTLGRFGIQIDGRALTARELRQQKPIELLQCLIALGGRGVSKDYLSAAVWPESEGDGAMNSYDVTLHRLRKLLRYEQALIASDSRLTLSSETVWVDAWTFEKLLNHIESALRIAGEADLDAQLGRHLERATALYQGGFLAREPQRAWGLSQHERLRSKFLRCIIQVGRQAELGGRWPVAEHCYQTGIEIDPLYELFYQRLMRCYLETNRNSAALSVYLRCRANLAAGLGVAPSQDTERLRSAL